MKTVPFYLPVNLDLQMFSHMKPSQKEKHLFVINTVCYKTYFQEYCKDENGFVFLSFKELQSVLSDKEIRPIKSKLIELGVLIENSSYSVGNFPKSYKLASAYQESELGKYFAGSPIVLRNIDAIKKSKIDYPKNLPELNCQLKNLRDLVVDVEAMMNYLCITNDNQFSDPICTNDNISIKYSISEVKVNNDKDINSTLYVCPIAVNLSHLFTAIS